MKNDGTNTPPVKKMNFLYKSLGRRVLSHSRYFPYAREGCGIQKGGEKNGKTKEVGKHKIV